jgi:hypothetical protein
MGSTHCRLRGSGLVLLTQREQFGVLGQIRPDSTASMPTGYLSRRYMVSTTRNLAWLAVMRS